jgi:hypothetical protein
MGPDPVPVVIFDAAGGDELLRACLATPDGARLRVSGRCMEPALRPGDVAVLASPALNPPRIGDIVLLRIEGDLRLHRLIWSWPTGRGPLRTKADRHAAWDAAVSRDAVLAKVVAVETAVGRRTPSRLRPALLSVARALLSRRPPRSSAGVAEKRLE